MMTKKRCIPILLLFYILLFSKTFCQQIKVAIGRNHLKELNVFGWNERFEFELRLFVVNLNTGNVITRFVAEGKTGHYDLATLEIEPHGKVTVEHVENIREEELPQSSRKGSGIARGRFELQIYMISPENINIKKTKKRFEKLPKGNEILLCLFNSIEGCEVITDEMKIMELERPKRNILFKMKLQKDEILHFQAIECTEIKDQFLNIKNLNVLSDGVGIEYDGPVCPMDKYTFHFLDINGKGTFNPFNCDEAIYFPKMNHYELLANGNCKLKLIEDNSNKDVKNTQGPQSSSAVAHSHSQQQMNKLKGKGISASNLPMNPPSLFPGKSWTNLMDFSRMSHQQAQFTHQFHSNPSIIHDTNTNPAIEKIIKQLAKDQPTFVAQFRPEHLKQAVNQFLQQQIQSQNSNAGIPSQSHNLLKSANVPRAHSTHQHSTISIATHQQHKPHISNSNPSYGSIAAGQNPPPTNFQRSQIPFALADQKLTKYLHENFDLKKHPQQILNDFEQHLQQYLADHQLPYVEPMPIYDSSHQQLINFEQKNIPQKNYYPNHMAIGNIQSGEYHPLLQQIFGQQQIGHFQSQKQIYHPNPTPPSSASLHQPLMEASASAAGKKRKELMPVEGQSQSESIPMDSNPAPKDVNLGLGLPSTGSSSNPPSSSAIGSFNCDEAIYYSNNVFVKETNTYHFSNGKCQLLLHGEIIDHKRNMEGLLKMMEKSPNSEHNISASSFIFGIHPHQMNQQMERNKSHDETSQALVNWGRQFSQKHAQPSQSHSKPPRIPPSIVAPPAKKFAPILLAPHVKKNFQRQLSQPNLQSSQAGTSSLHHLLRSNTMTRSDLNTPIIMNELHNLHIQSSNPIHGSSITAGGNGQNIRPNNFQPFQIAATSRQAQQQQTQISDPIEILSKIFNKSGSFQTEKHQNISATDNLHILESSAVPQQSTEQQIGPQIGPFQSEKQIHQAPGPASHSQQPVEASASRKEKDPMTVQRQSQQESESIPMDVDPSADANLKLDLGLPSIGSANSSSNALRTQPLLQSMDPNFQMDKQEGNENQVLQSQQQGRIARWRKAKID